MTCTLCNGPDTHADARGCVEWLRGRCDLERAGRVTMQRLALRFHIRDAHSGTGRVKSDGCEMCDVLSTEDSPAADQLMERPVPTRIVGLLDESATRLADLQRQLAEVQDSLLAYRGAYDAAVEHKRAVEAQLAAAEAALATERAGRVAALTLLPLCAPIVEKMDELRLQLIFGMNDDVRVYWDGVFAAIADAASRLVATTSAALLAQREDELEVIAALQVFWFAEGSADRVSAALGKLRDRVEGRPR